MKLGVAGQAQQPPFLALTFGKVQLRTTTRGAASRDPGLGVPVPSQVDGARAGGQQPSGAIHSMHILLSARLSPFESLPRPIACGLGDDCHLSVPGPPSSNVTAGRPDQPRGPQSELGACRNRSAKSGLRGMIAIDGASSSGRPCDATMSSAKSSRSFSSLLATGRHGHRSLTCQARWHSLASQCHKARNSKQRYLNAHRYQPHGRGQSSRAHFPASSLVSHPCVRAQPASQYSTHYSTVYSSPWYQEHFRSLRPIK